MSVGVIVGIQWGDEGKGKVVDYLTQNAQYVVRFQGGNNAGHTVVVDGKKFALRLIPSGILRENVCCLLASSVVVNPWAFLSEIADIEKTGIEIKPNRLKLAPEVQLILPYHQAIDEARENQRGAKKIGTTRKGIGPAYEDSVGRHGIRVCDLFDQAKLRALVERNIKHAKEYCSKVLETNFDINAQEQIEQLLQIAQKLRPFVCDVSRELTAAIAAKKTIVFEGAQGTLLDVAHGTYPFVTSSHTIAPEACVSAGIGTKSIDYVLGISKAYCTRVGGGPFPTEEMGKTGDQIRTTGNEFGTVTGRPRRCGWIDLPLLRRAIRLNGVDSILLTKLDVLTGIDILKVATHYEYQGRTMVEPDWDTDLEKVQVVYEEFLGWKEDISKATSLFDLPVNAQTYLQKIEQYMGCSLSGFSIGPERSQTIVYSNHVREIFGLTK
ncbi:MAG: adenylosuccinate synthase [Deltaproteobacteria bacterium]|nr:adenylosuccinate synthase [Deltaproteobacteria bacterium]